jgi:hypothetical protein
VQIIEWCDEPTGLTGSPAVRLDRAVAVEADGPRAGPAAFAECWAAKEAARSHALALAPHLVSLGNLPGERWLCASAVPGVTGAGNSRPPSSRSAEPVHRTGICHAWVSRGRTLNRRHAPGEPARRAADGSRVTRPGVLRHATGGQPDRVPLPRTRVAVQ